MLVIKRKHGESFTIGSDIRITVQKGHNVHLAIDAPRSTPITRFELIKAKKPDPTRNVQARLDGSHHWNNYGDVSREEAVRLEATKVAIGAAGSPLYTWVIEVRVEGEDTSRAVARVQTFVGADVLSFESQEAPYRE